MKFAWNLHKKIDLFETQLRSRGLTEAGEAIGGHIGVLFRVERRRFVARVVDGQRRVGEFLGSDEPAALHLLEEMFDILFRWKDSLDNLIKLEFFSLNWTISPLCTCWFNCPPGRTWRWTSGVPNGPVRSFRFAFLNSITTFRSFPDSFNPRELSVSRKWILSSLNNELISFYEKSFGSEPV